MKFLVAALLVALVAACGGGSTQSDTTMLTDLRSVDQLKSLFNEHADHPQLILLVSPT